MTHMQRKVGTRGANSNRRRGHATVAAHQPLIGVIVRLTLWSHLASRPPRRSGPVMFHLAEDEQTMSRPSSRTGARATGMIVSAVALSLLASPSHAQSGP